jgi:hypothetical protein
LKLARVLSSSDLLLVLYWYFLRHSVSMIKLYRASQTCFYTSLRFCFLVCFWADKKKPLALVKPGPRSW